LLLLLAITQLVMKHYDVLLNLAQINVQMIKAIMRMMI